ncbi:DUF927 domain-containing protein [Salmonella enterica]|nr:DUF927 domain-containing protein [Salmonella enterica]EJX3287937.1 DUF927 domain-containing protein [Salmonella enterica]EJX3310569.1 DUF927 domain-containing protein [Salmonella enterica]EKQ0892572.1 DUF927 domain-containing protein [Salmonella enterica]
MASIRFSRGSSQKALTVEQRSAASEDEFIDLILNDVACAKYKQFFCAPMHIGIHPKAAKEPEKYSGEKYWRLLTHAEPWRVARFDCDGFDSPQTFEALKSYLTKFKGFLYTTTNYTPTSPRCRFVILLDKEVNRDEGKRVCKGIATEIDRYLQESADLIGGWQPAISWDESVYLAEQQCYMPVVDSTGTLKTKSGEKVTDAITLRFEGELANVAHYLAIVPEEAKSRQRKTDISADQTDPATREYWELWEGIDQHTMDDLRSALFSPGMIKISEGERKPWQAVISRLGYLKDTPFEDAAYQLALEWSEAGGAAFDMDAFTQTWETSRADLTSYKAVFTEAQRKGWENPQTLRPYLEKEKTGFYMTGEGLMENIEVGSRNAREIVARKVSAAFAVRGRTRDAYGDNWGRLLEFRDFDGETKHYVVPDEHLHKQGSDVPQRLAAMGLWINSGMAKSLLTYLNIASAPGRITCTAITGWHDGKVFVLPDRSIGKDAGSVMYQHRGRDKCQLAQSGTLTEWQQHIAAKCAGNSRLVFSVCVALAAPLMDLAGVDGGVFSLLGASTKGKSTAQHVAASVWGKGTTSGGYVRSWNTSLVGLEVMATTHNDLPLILDELKAVSAKIVGSTAYMLAMGRGKERGTKDITLREALQWRTQVLASSERPFGSYIKAAGETVEAGQQARFVDVPAIVSETTGLFDTLHGLELTEEYAKQFADGLNRSAETYYGTPGIAWLEYITREGRSKLVNWMNSLHEDFRRQYRPQDTGAQLDRVMDRFTLCAVAGEVATAAGITGWQKGEAFKGVGSCFLAYVAERGTLRDMEGVNGVDHLRQYLSDYGHANFMRSTMDHVRVHDGFISPMDGDCCTDFDNLDVNAVQELEGEGVAECYWILPAAMQRILANHNHNATMKALVALGALVCGTNKDGSVDYNPRKNDPVLGWRRRYYRVDANVLFS